MSGAYSGQASLRVSPILADSEADLACLGLTRTQRSGVGGRSCDERSFEATMVGVRTRHHATPTRTPGHYSGHGKVYSLLFRVLYCFRTARQSTESPFSLGRP